MLENKTKELEAMRTDLEKARVEASKEKSKFFFLLSIFSLLSMSLLTNKSFFCACMCMFVLLAGERLVLEAQIKAAEERHAKTLADQIAQHKNEVRLKNSCIVVCVNWIGGIKKIEMQKAVACILMDHKQSTHLEETVRKRTSLLDEELNSLKERFVTRTSSTNAKYSRSITTLTCTYPVQIQNIHVPSPDIQISHTHPLQMQY